MIALNQPWRLQLVMFLLLCVGTAPSHALGEYGHRLASKITEAHLSQPTREALRAIAGDSDLAALALWADKIRGNPAWSKSKYWHYINVEDGESIAAHKHVPEGDILLALNDARSQLQDKRLPPQQRRQALAFFVHFVQDLHQPLHVGRAADRGGNRIKIRWLGERKQRNLHWAWDTGLLLDDRLTVEQHAQILGQLSPRQIALWKKGSFTDWAKESMALRPQVYEFGPAKQGAVIVLDQAYADRNRPILEKRLAMSAIRLADQLNRIFDPAD